AMQRPDVFWAHPVPRRYDDPLRKHVRARFREYAPPGGANAAAAPDAGPPLLRALPLLAQMRKVEGWLDDDEADLLIAAAAAALREAAGADAVVEVGSHCGRGT